MNQSVEQTFNRGMRQDVDEVDQPAGSYRYARNGRLLYNTESDSEKGKSMTFSNVRGNAFVQGLPVGYTVLDLFDSRLGSVVFSCNGDDSEIGIWPYDTEQDGTLMPGSYYPIYNDRYDPHLLNQPYRRRGADEAATERLGLAPADRIEAWITYENEQTERLYFTNRRGPKYVLNLRAVPSSRNADTNYYPSYWSLHAFRDRPDLVFPLVKLAGRGKGRLTSGAYQLAVQYKNKDGIRSAISPITERVPVTSEPMDAYNPDGSQDTILTAAYRSNHHNRTMSASGKVTGESLFWQLRNVDVRWNQLVVIVLYYETQGEPLSITALDPIDITPDADGTLALLEVEIKQVDGEELTLADLSNRNEVVLTTGTLAPNQGRLFEGKLTRLKPFGMATKNVRFEPFLKSMRADNTKEPIFKSITNLISGRNDNDPLTNSAVTINGIILRQQFEGVLEAYPVYSDYMNDKGQVWEWLHGSYFRGETYEFAAVVLDRLGQPMFAVPLPAYTFPEQYALGPNGEPDYYSLTKQSDDGLYDLRLMGLKLSGLRLPIADLYDQDNRLNVSGFMIVRRKRIERLVHQGLVFPVCRAEGVTGGQDCDEKYGRTHKPFPLPWTNYFEDNYGRANHHLYTHRTPCGTANDDIWKETFTQPFYLNYHSPDVLIEESLASLQPGDVLKNVGIVGQAYGNETIAILPRPSEIYPHHSYTKSINTSTVFSRLASLVSQGRPKLGSSTRISLSLLLNQGFGATYEKFDKDDLNLQFETGAHPEWVAGRASTAFDPGAKTFYGDGLIQRNSVLIKTSSWESVDIAESRERGASFRVVNYLRASPERSTETEPYYATGHFQPLTQSVLDVANPIHDDNGKLTHYEFNGVEVWGGDAYVTPFDFTRMYPFPSDTCEKHDYSISHIAPIESKYNLMLREGRSFARSAVRPEVTTCNNIEDQLLNGVMHQQPEDWNYNKVLLVDTSAVSYAPQPRDFLPVTYDPNGFSWTPIKAPGQLLDNWRMKLAGDAGQADGTMGPLSRLVQSDQGLYAWHEKGVELLPLDPLSLNASDAGTILTSSGATFHRGLPISKTYGTQHPDSIWQMNGQMGAWDARLGVLLRHTAAGLDVLSQSENINDLMQAFSLPYSSADVSALKDFQVATGIDLENGEVILSFYKQNGNGKALVYSPALSTFIGETDAQSLRYARRGRLLVSTNPLAPNTLWAHNHGQFGQFYGNYFPTVLRFVTNPAASQSKVFNNGHIIVNVEGQKKISQLIHSTPNGGEAQRHVLSPQEDSRFRFYHQELQYPIHEWDWERVKQRLRDKYMRTELTIQNDQTNTPVHISSYRTIFRMS